MHVDTLCPVCLAPYRASSDFAGRNVTCAKCGENFALPVATPKVGPARPIGMGEYRYHLGWAITFISGFVWLVTIRTSDFAVVHYISLLILAGAIAYHLLARMRLLDQIKGYAPIIVIGIAIVVAVTWALFDYSTNDWFDDKEGRSYHYTDYTYRGHSQPYWRDVLITGKSYLASVEGGYSKSGKQHGQWTFHETDFSDSLASDTRYIWYWYGEEITEGEWHLRNKD